jgi:hypothetical protein
VSYIKPSTVLVVRVLELAGVIVETGLAIDPERVNLSVSLGVVHGHLRRVNLTR